MNTKLKVRVIEENAVVGHSFDRLLSAKGHKVSTTLKAANDGKKHTRLNTIGMLIAAPLLALGYVIALPFVGFTMFTRLALEARAKRIANC
jgi:hypothetical protein